MATIDPIEVLQTPTWVEGVAETTVADMESRQVELLQRLEGLNALQRHVSLEIDKTVTAARVLTISWAKIGKRLRMSPQGAAQHWTPAGNSAVDATQE